MKKLAGAMIIGLLLVPWPIWGVPVFGPHLRGVLPPDEIEFMAPLMLAVVVYPLIGLFAFITLGSIEYMERRTTGAVRHAHTPVAGASVSDRCGAESRKHERERQKRKQKAREDGALLILLAELTEDDRRRR